jgi:DNA helicase IV
MLKNARALLRANGWRMSAAHDWMNRITSEHRLQVFVDEATDFSAVQLACTIELSHPRVRSWFACGDLNQRITEHGVQHGAEFDWIGATTGQAVDIRQIRIAYRQSARLRELAVALSAESSALPLPNTEMEYQEVSPFMLEGVRGDVVAKWVADRVIEIERALGSVPSIAVFVDGEEQIDPIVKALQVHLAPQNIGVIGCPDGRTVGDTQDVRVFNVQHIKGLEFEAVFFVAVDRLAERLPALFDRYLFVGVSRAATYLGITCESALPTVLEPVRAHFSTGVWA